MLAEALEAYRAPLLSRSGTMAVQLLRDRLDLALCAAVRSTGDAGLISRWLSTDMGSADFEAVQARQYCEHKIPTCPRESVRNLGAHTHQAIALQTAGRGSSISHGRDRRVASCDTAGGSVCKALQLVGFGTVLPLLHGSGQPTLCSPTRRPYLAGRRHFGTRNLQPTTPDHSLPPRQHLSMRR